jgi:hypothetical protein
MVEIATFKLAIIITALAFSIEPVVVNSTMLRNIAKSETIQT